jgi:cell division protein FtsW (lipid II flippase)
MKNMRQLYLEYPANTGRTILIWKTIAGQRCWYAIGSFTIQPSEFAKAATSLALAKFLRYTN